MHFKRACYASLMPSTSFYAPLKCEPAKPRLRAACALDFLITRNASTFLSDFLMIRIYYGTWQY